MYAINGIQRTMNPTNTNTASSSSTTTGGGRGGGEGGGISGGRSGGRGRGGGGGGGGRTNHHSGSSSSSNSNNNSNNNHPTIRSSGGSSSSSSSTNSTTNNNSNARGGGSGGGRSSSSGGRSGNSAGGGHRDPTTTGSTNQKSSTSTANQTPSSSQQRQQLPSSTRPPQASTSASASASGSATSTSNVIGNNQNNKSKSSSHRNRSRGKQPQPHQQQQPQSKISSVISNESKQKDDAEQKRLDEIRIANALIEQQLENEQRAELQRMETIRYQLELQQKGRDNEIQQRTSTLLDAIRIVQYTYDISQDHHQSRDLYQNTNKQQQQSSSLSSSTTTTASNTIDRVKEIRMAFEIRKKSIKVDLKKCTTFIKKIKLGTYWNNNIGTSTGSSTNTSNTSTVTTTSHHNNNNTTMMMMMMSQYYPTIQQYQSMKTMMDTITNDVASLNLSRYVEEVVTAILESCSISSNSSGNSNNTMTTTTSTSTTTNTNTNNTSTTTTTTTTTNNPNKMSTTELSVIVALIQAMHVRYADFLSNLLPPLWNALIHDNHHNNTNHNKHHRRLYVRLYTELMLHGLLSNHEIQKFIKCVSEWTGGIHSNNNNTMKADGPSTNSNDTTTTPAVYVVQDAVAIVAFIRTAGFEVLGIIPTTIQNAIRTIQKEYELYQQKNDEQQRVLDSNHNKKADDAVLTKEQDGSDSSPPAVDQSSDSSPIVLDATLLDDAMKIVGLLEPVLKEQRAVPEVTSVNLAKHCLGAYKAMCTTYIQTHQKMKKLEKRCEQDRLIAGQLTAQREKGFTDAQKLCDTLQKSVEVLSDCLHEPMPIIISDDENDGDRTTNAGAGIEVWTKDNEGANENYGPFDDEETRSFYCDIPDLLATNPPALLGLSDELVERQKLYNVQKYSVGSTTMTMEENGSTNNDVAMTPTSSEQLDDTEHGAIVLDDDDVERNKNEGENKDTPHYRLMTLLEQELPECNRREQLDEIAEKFATNHGSSKNSRKRLLKALFLVPRSRLDLLPFYSRLITTLDHVYADLSTTLVTSLAQQFHGQAKFKKNQNIESRMRTARYLGELTKFRCAPPIVILNCLALCNEDFTGPNVEIACCILESCGRFLYRTKHTNPRIVAMMETMTRLSKAKNLDERLQSLLKAAFYNVKPPQTATRKKMKEYPPLEAYLRHLLLVRLEASESGTSMVTKQLVRMPWFDPSYQCGALICKLMLKACRKGRYKTIEAVAAVAAKLRTQRAAGEVPIRLTDAVLEELRWALEQPNFRDQQRIITYTRLLGELHVTGQVSAVIIIDQLYEFINYGHLIPESLREASKEFISKVAVVEADQSDLNKLPVYNSAGTVSQVIQEDEEMEDAELITNVVEVEEAPKPVAVSPYSIFDPRVPSAKDSSTSTYRITLVCTLLETSARALITRSNLQRLKGFFAAFQRYLFTKMVLPTDVEFALLDTFDVVDSHWKRVSSGRGGGNSNSLDSGFPRYSTWLEAHAATVLVEESEATFQAQKRARLEAVADDSKSLPEVSSTEDDPDEGSLFHDDDESDSSGDDDGEESVSVKSKDSGGVDVDVALDDDGNEMDIARDEDIGPSIDSDDGEDDGESDESDEDDENEDEEYYDDEDEEEEFDEDAYMLQLEEEAFERELRILTMEAIEKGKVQSRKQVDDSMISGSQIMKRKPTTDSSSKFTTTSTDPTPNNTGIALSGGTGISFQVIKKGNKGKIELKELVVPVDTNLAVAATRHDDAAAKERNEIKQRVLRYEAQSEFSTGGNVYLEQGRLERNRNRPLSMDVIDKNFGTSGGNLHPSQTDKKVIIAPPSGSTSTGRGSTTSGTTYGGRGPSSTTNPGRGSGRGGGGGGGGRTNIGGRRLF